MVRELKGFQAVNVGMIITCMQRKQRTKTKTKQYNDKKKFVQISHLSHISITVRHAPVYFYVNKTFNPNNVLKHFRGGLL